VVMAWAEARTALSLADQSFPLAADDLELLATAATSPASPSWPWPPRPPGPAAGDASPGAR
jgi:hypothetical protein